jgi:hypothetical protein
LHSQLDLRGNGLGNDGAIIIGRGLRTAESKVLGELDLGYNEIKDDGACALAQVRGSGVLEAYDSWGYSVLSCLDMRRPQREQLLVHSTTP